MVHIKSLDHNNVIAVLLQDVQSRTKAFTPRSLTLTLRRVRERMNAEGLSFLTKTLPRLEKALNRALSGDTLNSVGWRKLPNSQLPRFLGELFSRVFSHDGKVLPLPCVECIRCLRQILGLYYKYKLPYDESVAGNCCDQFEETDRAVSAEAKFSLSETTIAKAQKLLAELFCNFDYRRIVPKHGPGAVSQKEKRSQKYAWTKIPPRTYNVFPLDEYYYASAGHVVDRLEELLALPEGETSARVLLVPKDSRGPRIISCEPKEFQWLQQGLMKAIVELVEAHPLTRGSVNFTDQQPNRLAALAASRDGGHVTIDLKEASDRVSVALVELLFPEHVKTCLFATRSLSTVLPNGKTIVLNKFAPMGSALCFPVMALTIWAVLSAGGCAEYGNILVYGDDVIVHKAHALNAMSLLESVNLAVNKDKSCIDGLFRESCGMDAYSGIDVTPVRFRTVWSSHRAAGAYSSWIAYANQLFVRGFHQLASYIAEELVRIYRTIPDERDMSSSYPHFIFMVPSTARPRRRGNSNLQKLELYVWVVESVKVTEEYDGWNMLLRFFTEACEPSSHYQDSTPRWSKNEEVDFSTSTGRFQASSYTLRRRSLLRQRWR